MDDYKKRMTQTCDYCGQFKGDSIRHDGHSWNSCDKCEGLINSGIQLTKRPQMIAWHENEMKRIAEQFEALKC